MAASPAAAASSVYGPTQSWRFGRSLGIDPIGAISTCPFGCVYCQLGTIERQTLQRQVYVPTAKIAAELRAIAPQAPCDAVTLSGSGEPTLAANLDEILQVAREVVGCPTVVLTNGALLTQPQVRRALQQADIVAVKLDAISEAHLQGVNRPLAGLQLPAIARGLEQFRQGYTGHLAIQTMLLAPWSPERQAAYSQYLQRLAPDEVQLNLPRRRPSRDRQLAARGNEFASDAGKTRQPLKCVDLGVLQDFAATIRQATGLYVRYPC